MDKMLKVFIADDSSLIRETIILFLSVIPNVKITGQAEDVPEAIRLIQEKRPDVAILDIQMPGGNGIDVLAKVKKLEPPPVVIMFTNHAFPPYEKTCMKEGADFFFDKSKDFLKIRKVINQLLEHGNSSTRIDSKKLIIRNQSIPKEKSIHRLL